MVPKAAVDDGVRALCELADEARLGRVLGVILLSAAVGFGGVIWLVCYLCGRG